MNLNLLIAVTIFATPIAQKDDPADNALIVQDAQKVVQAISNDKAKLQAYCELGKLEDQMAKGDEREVPRQSKRSSQRSTLSHTK